MGAIDREKWQQHYHSDSGSIQRGEVSIARRGTRILVAAPYREEFRLRARAILGAKWRQAIKVWSFPMCELGLVRDAIDAVYGAHKVPQWMQDSATDGGER